jgi:hypothetical protein
MADDKKARLVELQKSASELRDPANQARLVEPKELSRLMVGKAGAKPFHLT